MFDWNVFSLLDFLGSFYILSEFNNSGRLFHWKLNSLFKQKFDVHAVFTSITKFLIVHSFLKDCFAIWKKNKIRPVQAESSKFELLLFDQGFKIVIPPRSPASVPEPIGTSSDCILNRSDCCSSSEGWDQLRRIQKHTVQLNKTESIQLMRAAPLIQSAVRVQFHFTFLL